MRFLHLSDIHAGKTLGKVSRNEDVYYSLEQVYNFCKENKVNFILIAGDIFDKANPDSDAKEIIFEFFLKINSLKIPVILISGNHDSYEFMRSLRNLLKVINVYVFPKPDLNNAVFSLNDVKIACLPYPSERVLTGATGDSKLTYSVAVEKALKYLANQVKEAKFKILLSHLFVAGAKYTKTEREATITEFYAVKPQSIPEEFDYVALGHVHRYQRVEGAVPVAYYTGSIYQLDFAEAGNEKFFNYVELSEGAPPKVEQIKLSLKNPLNVFEVSQEDYVRKLEEIKRCQGLLKIELTVSDRTKVNFVVERIKEALGDRLIKIELKNYEKLIKRNETREVKEINLLELYKQYHKETYGKYPSEEVLKVFSELMEEVRKNVS